MPLEQERQIKVTKCEITSAKGGEAIPVVGILRAFSVIEDLYSPFLTATLAFQDAYGLIAKHEILGCADKLELSFETPDKKTISVELYSYGISPRSHVLTRTDFYEINFVSKEAYTNEWTTISKYYKKKLHEIAKEIAEEDLEMDITVEVETEEEIELIIPNWSAMQAIQWVLARAIPKDNPWDNSFFFWQDIEAKYHITTMAKMFEDADKPFGGSPTDGYKHTRRPGAMKPDDALKMISRMQFTNFDNLNQITDGHDRSITLTHDITRKNFIVSEYNAKEMFDNATKLIDQRPRKYAEDGDNPYKPIYEEDANPPQQRFYPKSQYLFNLEEDKSGQDKVGKEDSPEEDYDWLSSKLHQDWRIRSMKSVIEVPGWSDRKVGEIITIAREDTAPGEEGEEQREDKEDKFSYGDYLITTINHVYDNTKQFNHGSEYKCVMDLIRDSVKG